MNSYMYSTMVVKCQSSAELLHVTCPNILTYTPIVAGDSYIELLCTVIQAFLLHFKCDAHSSDSWHSPFVCTFGSMTRPVMKTC